MNDIVHVAVGVICTEKNLINADDYKVFLAKRPQHVHMGGFWEFPGGKVEKSESVLDALRRELKEELDVYVESAAPLIKIRHEYPDKTVLLDTWLIDGFTGDLKGAEGQQTEWVSVATLRDYPEKYPLPPANKPILKALALPDFIAITPPEVIKDFSACWVNRLDEKLVSNKQRIAVYLRDGEGLLDKSKLKNFLLHAEEAKIPIIINQQFFEKYDFDGFTKSQSFFAHHLKSRDLIEQGDAVDLKQQGLWVGASCHDEKEIDLVHSKNIDYIFMSPVQKTQTHPDSSPLGWNVFEQICETGVIPVYALGGVAPSDFELVRSRGGQGVAGIQSFWKK